MKWHVLLVVTLLLAGCSGGKGPASVDDAAEPGAIRVVVASENDLPIKNARVSVLGTQSFGDTREDGTIVFRDLFPGNYEVSVQATSFLPAKQQVAVQPGATSNVSFAMRLDPTQPENPHLHDLWRGQDTYVMMDAVIDITKYPPNDKPFTPVEEPLGGMVLRPNGVAADDSFFIPLVDEASDRPIIVLPGTKNMTITVDWDPANVGFDNLRIQYDPPNGNGQTTDWFAPGESVTIPVEKEWWDDGHRTFSRWMLRGLHDNQADDPTGWTPIVVVDGNVGVRIELERGALQLDAAHPDLWGGASELVLRKSSAGNGGAPIGVGPRDPEGGIRLDEGKIVPPDAQILRVEFRWTHNAGDGYGVREDYELTWRTAAQNPQTTDITEFQRMDAVEGSAAQQFKVYEIPLAQGDGDSVYDTHTAWRFVPWMSAGPEDGYRVGGVTQFDMVVTALK